MELLDTIFEGAREIPDPIRRAKYLSEACGGDLELRARVDIMLRDAPEAGDFFRSLDDAVASPFFEQPGTSIGRYKLLQKVGEGGCGVVYMAEQEEPVRRRVALKLIKPGMDTKNVVARFEAERQALALMDHPNIARVFDGGATEQGRPYFVMELVRGIRITDYCDQHELSMEARLQLFFQVCEAVQHAHQKGIIHRDLKPSNILVTVNEGKPVPKVIDFGIAKATEQPLTDKTLFTRFEAFIGTPAYMSPEQADMSSLDIDTRSDIYSLGVLLYELLTGQTPFDQKELLKSGIDEIRRTIRQKEPARPSKKLDTLPREGLTTTANKRGIEGSKLLRQLRGDLDWIVMKCLEKDRRRRYETTDSLAGDLKRYLKSDPVQARPPSSVYRLQKTIRRHKFAFGAGVAVLGALLLGLGVSIALLVRARAAESEQARLRGQAERAEQAKADELWRSYLAQAQAARQTLQAGRREVVLNAVRKAAALRPSFELRNEAIAALALTDLGPPRLWRDFAPTDDPMWVYCAVMDADLKRYALFTAGDVSVRRVADQHELLRFPQGARNGHRLVFSRDDRWLALRCTDGWIRVWDLNGRTLAFQTRLSAELHGSLDISPDSHWLAAGSEGKLIHLYNLEQHFISADNSSNQINATRSLPVSATPAFVCFAPTGHRLLVASSEQWQVWDWKESRLIRAQERNSAALTRLAWHPDGRTLAAGSDSGSISLWNIESGRNRVLRGHDAPTSLLAFHPRGDVLSSSSWDGTMRLWDVHTGHPLLSTDQGFNAHFGQDGQGLMLYREWSDLGIWPVVQSRVFRTLVSKPGVKELVGRLNFSSDGGLLAWSNGEEIWSLDIATGEMKPHKLAGVKDVFFKADNGRSMFALTDNQLLRWSLNPSNTSPKVVSAPEAYEEVCRATNQAFVCAARSSAGLLVLAGQHSWRVFGAEGKMQTFEYPDRVRPLRIAVSPDHRWVAFGQWNGMTVVCDPGTGKVVKEFPSELAALVAFTPDGRWLVTCGREEYRFWAAGTWQPGWRFARQARSVAGAMAFSRDGRLMALFRELGQVQLLDLQTGLPLADLKAPTPGRTGAISFSVDGSLLACGGTEGIQLWDLRALRQELTNLNLDWDQPPYPPSVTSLAKTVFHADANPTRQ